MSSAKVTRQHRELATEALMLGVSDALFAFEFGGETCDDEHLEEAARVAQALADIEQAAEERGAERERERIRAAIAVLRDKMLVDAYQQGVQASGDDGIYRDELDTLRAVEREVRGEHGRAGG